MTDTPPTADDARLRAMTTRDQVRQPVRRSAKRVTALTILWHADPSRVGDRALLAELDGGQATLLSRLEPEFAAPDGTGAAPLLDPYVSRRGVELTRAAAGAVALSTTPDGPGLRVDGAPVRGRVELGTAALDQGVVVELAGRVLLLLQRVIAAPPPPVDASLAVLAGISDAMVQLREQIGLAASVDAPVLVRGETGTGKELVARAVHAASARARRPFVSVNAAAIAPATAQSQLFGHVRGAFTGATSDHRGHFGEADRGTLFLDEIGATPAAIQPMLLRALEAGEVQPVGAGSPRRVDVRLVAATDADLDGAVEAGTFSRALLHRVAGLDLRTPPLRARREDITLLLREFLQDELAPLGASARLLGDPADRSPWLSIEVASALARHDWPGNVRELKNVARQLAVLGARRLALSVDDLPESVRGSAPATLAASAPRAPGKLRPEDIDDHALLEALRAHEFQMGATARALGISRTSLYALVERSPRVRKAGDLTAEEIAAARAEAGGDLRAMARALEVSRQGLTRRMKQLGL